jgi:hypothetical protein
VILLKKLEGDFALADKGGKETRNRVENGKLG